MVGPPGVTFVAVVEGEVAGSANAYANRAGRRVTRRLRELHGRPGPRRAGRRPRARRAGDPLGAEAGFPAIQFNAVVETNERAMALWRSLGFETIGTVPEAFRLPDGTLTGLHVMYRRLDPA